MAGEGGLPLHLTKIAFGCAGAEDLRQRLEAHAPAGRVELTTRYRPKRAEELAGGSLYWIHGGRIVGRSPILGFGDRDDGRVSLFLEPCLIDVRPQAKRPHQGWRYLDGKDAPPDLGDGRDGPAGDPLPPHLARELERLGLIQ